MRVGIDMGQTPAGMAATLDLEELLATRLLVQGNSGSGKSHLLRRLAEQSAPYVQQAFIDPEGDFVTLADRFGHVVVDAAEHKEGALQQIAARIRQHRVSVVLNLENLEADLQMRYAAAFLGGLFDVDRDFWYPMVVVVDEAQLFAPAAAGEVSDEARKASLGAMTNLMCRGRKRGLAGIIATQRLAKLAKNVAAEASNFLMGRTFLDIDMARAADLLGMERRQAEMFRDLQRGQFIALGPALSRRPLQIKIGAVETHGRAGSPKLLPLPETPTEDVRELIFSSTEPEPPRYVVRRPSPAASADLMARLERAEAEQVAPLPTPPASPFTPAADPGNDKGLGEKGPSYEDIIREVLADPETCFRSVAVLYQDFLVRCRTYNVNGRVLDLAAFRRKLAAARTDLDGAMSANPDWEKAEMMAASLAEDIQGVYLLLARAAIEGTPCPPNSEIARIRGSRSPRRALGLLSHMEGQGLIVVHNDVDLDGNRVIGLPGLDLETAPGHPDAVVEEEA